MEVTESTDTPTNGPIGDNPEANIPENQGQHYRRDPPPFYHGDDELPRESPPHPNHDTQLNPNDPQLESSGSFNITNQIGPTNCSSNNSSVTRVYKKCASNGSLAIYVGTRTLTIHHLKLEPLHGVLVFDKEALSTLISPNFRIWGQITLTFRYGREDEEVLGLRFCNEAILALREIWPGSGNSDRNKSSRRTSNTGTISSSDDDGENSDADNSEEDLLTPLQAVLLERVRSSASTTPSIHSLPFTLCAGPVGLGSFPPPPSVLLAPAKPYKGSPIGTIYDLRIYASDHPQERPPRRNLIRLALRTVQAPQLSPSLLSTYQLSSSLCQRPAILGRGKISFKVELNRNIVRYGESIEVSVKVKNGSRVDVRGIKVHLVQQVDVCMFTSGKFKNIVGSNEDPVLILPGSCLNKTYKITPIRGPARQWLALEEAFGRESLLSPSTMYTGDDATVVGTTSTPAAIGPPPTKKENESSDSKNPNSRNVFAIIVTYYAKVKLLLPSKLPHITLTPPQIIKIPFILLPPENTDPDPYPEIDLKTLLLEIQKEREKTLKLTKKREEEGDDKDLEGEVVGGTPSRRVANLTTTNLDDLFNRLLFCGK